MNMMQFPTDVDELQYRLSIATALLAGLLIETGRKEFTLQPPNPEEEMPPEWEVIHRIGMGSNQDKDGTLTLFVRLKGHVVS